MRANVSARRRAAVLLAAVAVAAGACTSGGSAERAGTGQSSATGARTADGAAVASALFDSSTVHDVALEFNDAEYQEMVATYSSTGEKDWIEATVHIDGKRFERVGVRLKGNSSLRRVSASSDPASLPWLVRLDKYVDGQSYDGETEFVVRSNSTDTSLNEAVALELIGLAGEPTQKAIAVRFTVNGGAATLRLAIENPGDAWEDANFDGDGVLYKAESTGDYSYRGDDPDSYDEVFDQETDTDNENLEPLIEFLEFINKADDATFAAELDQRLDVEGFARYLTVQQLVSNWDDIDGPGNNSYLHYDKDSSRFAIVSWDLNLAFGVGPGGGGSGFPGREGAPNLGEMGPPPDFGGMGGAPGGMGGRRGGPGGRSNILVQRFTANADFAALVAQAKSDLTEQLYSSGTAAAVVDRWAALLTSQASDLVEPETVSSEAAAVKRYFG